jgi:hypothetical protein
VLEGPRQVRRRLTDKSGLKVEATHLTIEINLYPEAVALEQFSQDRAVVELGNFEFGVVAMPLTVGVAVDLILDDVAAVMAEEDGDDWQFKHVQAELIRASVLPVHWVT